MNAPQHWTQKGFAVVSNGPNDYPILHSFHMPEWEAQSQLERIKEQLPAKYIEGIQIIHAELKLEWPPALSVDGGEKE